VDDGRKKVLIKLIPRIDLQAISQKFVRPAKLFVMDT
jgi:hypothetical protein